MKGAKAAPKSVKSAEGTITKGKGKSTGGTAAAKKEATKKEVRRATEKMKKDLLEAIRTHEDGYLVRVVENFCKENTDFEFEEEELHELIYIFIESDCEDVMVVKFLVNEGLESCEFGYETPLVSAIQAGKFGAVEALLKEITVHSHEWDNIFGEALCFKNGSMMELLIEYGADVNADSESEGTVLHRAAVKAVALDDLTCLKLFLEAGAKERMVEGSDFVSIEALTPTQYIQKEFGEDGDKVGALERAVDLLYEYSSAGKRAAKLEAKVEVLQTQVDLIQGKIDTVVGKVDQVLSRMQAPVNNMPPMAAYPGFMPGLGGFGVQGFPGVGPRN